MGGKRADVSQIAVGIVEQVTGGVLKPSEGKNPHAQALSALGASKGGKARGRNCFQGKVIAARSCPP